MKLRIVSVAFALTIALQTPSRVRSESVEVDTGEQYFGVPLGAYHFSSDGTSAEIYAADEFTIIFNHFYHNPRDPGCTAMMLGPARRDDHDNVVEGHGVLIASAHPPVAARSLLLQKRRRRRRRRDAFLFGRGEGGPVEFDHLLMGPPVTETDTKMGSHRAAEVPEGSKVTVTTTTTMAPSSEKPMIGVVSVIPES